MVMLNIPDDNLVTQTPHIQPPAYCFNSAGFKPWMDNVASNLPV